MKPALFANVQLRNRQPEWMDDPELDPSLHQQALRGLERINRVSRSSTIVWRGVRRLIRDVPAASLRVLDLACGGGDVTRAIAHRAARAGLKWQVDGCDVSPVAIDHARRAGPLVGGGFFFEHDVVRNPLPPGYDVVVCSLFLHHLDEETAVVVLRRMAAAAERMSLVNDLARTRLGYILAFAATRLLSRSPVVHLDGPLSVAGAYTAAEALALAVRAGWREPAVARQWPQRFLLIGRRA